MSHQLAAGPAANIEGLVQLGELGLGLLLSAIIGLERKVRQKSAGLRTHSLVGVRWAGSHKQLLFPFSLRFNKNRLVQIPAPDRSPDGGPPS